MAYQGHKNWNHWNVSLWIGNDEGLYNMAREHVRHCPNRMDAAKAILDELEQARLYKTPDGARYTVSSIRAALVGM